VTTTAPAIEFTCPGCQHRYALADGFLVQDLERWTLPMVTLCAGCLVEVLNARSLPATDVVGDVVLCELCDRVIVQRAEPYTTRVVCEECAEELADDSR
jgi:hypothetical protein